MSMRGKQAFLVGILVFAALTAGVGALAGPPLSASEWTVPAPHVGDHGLYTIAMFDDEGIVMEERPYLRFTWLEPRVDLEFDGTAHWTNALQAERAIHGQDPDGNDVWWTRTTTYSIDAGDGAVVASNETLMSDVTVGAERTNVNMQTSRDFRGAEYQKAQFLCGLTGPLQGKTSGLRNELRIHEDCTVPFGVVWTPAWFEYQAVAIESLGDADAVRFHGEHAPDRFVVDYWYQDTPYPVKIATYLPNGTTAVTTLREFQRGDAPLTTMDEAPELVDLPPIRLAPVRPWGPEDGGVDHPFKASTAWAFAKSDPDWSALRDALEQDPSLRAERGDFSESVFVDGDAEPETTYRWSFHVPADPPLAFTVYDAPHEENTTLWPVPEMDAPERDRFVVEQETDGYCHEDTWIPEGTAVPTVASIWQQWLVQRGDRYAQELPNMWGFSICGWGESVDDRVWGGLDLGMSTRGEAPDALSRLQGAERSPSSSERLKSHLQIDNPTSAIYQRRSLDESWHGYGPSIEAPEPQPKAVLTPEPLDIEPWNVPPLPWWIGTGIIAAFVAGLLWTWPALKAGAWSLFSRHTHRAELLEDPMRRRIMDLVAQQPGIHVRALAGVLGVSNSTVLHHTRKLRSFRMLRVRREGQYTAFYAEDAGTMVAPPRSTGARAVVDALGNGPLDVRRVVEATGLSTSTVYHHVRRLESDGHIVKDGRLIRLA